LRESRLGCLKGGVKEIKMHAWFQTVDWDSVVRKKDIPPIRPKVLVVTYPLQLTFMRIVDNKVNLCGSCSAIFLLIIL
jgi:hypothetical protein